MNKKYYMLGIFLLGILVFNMSFGFTVAYDGGDDPPGDDPPEEPKEPEDPDHPEEPKEPEEPDNPEEPKEPEEPDHPEEPKEPEEPIDDKPDDDKDGVDDNYEEDKKRDICIWFGDNVIELASILRQEDQKDIIDLRIAYKEYGLSVRVSYGIRIRNEEPDHPEEPNGDQKDAEYGGEGEWTTEYKLEFEVLFRGFIEYVDLNDNGVYDHKNDTLIEDYGLHSWQPVSYSLTPISNDSNLHYFLLNTTDGVFAAHIYFVEEFVFVDDILITPTQVKIDIEITGFDYADENSQLALITKLRSETYDYEERDETLDEKDGYADEEKEVFIENDIYAGIFSWKETALIDGVEMEVKTNNLEVDVENEDIQVLLINYPRGNHIYHDPKIGISIMTITGAIPSVIPIIITGTVVSVIGIATISGLLLRKRRII
jgi:hypothetical protein